MQYALITMNYLDFEEIYKLIDLDFEKIVKLNDLIFTCACNEVEGARLIYLKEQDHDHGIFY